ncbi:hypothetical protein Hanom_Chr02g00155251 [Helianthus anomalus]
MGRSRRFRITESINRTRKIPPLLRTRRSKPVSGTTDSYRSRPHHHRIIILTSHIFTVIQIFIHSIIMNITLFTLIKHRPKNTFTLCNLRWQTLIIIHSCFNFTPTSSGSYVARSRSEE